MRQCFQFHSEEQSRILPGKRACSSFFSSICSAGKPYDSTSKDKKVQDLSRRTACACFQFLKIPVVLNFLRILLDFCYNKLYFSLFLILYWSNTAWICNIHCDNGRRGRTNLWRNNHACIRATTRNSAVLQNECRYMSLVLSSLYVCMTNTIQFSFVETLRKFIIAELSIRKLGSLLILALLVPMKIRAYGSKALQWWIYVGFPHS